MTTFSYLNLPWNREKRKKEWLQNIETLVTGWRSFERHFEGERRLVHLWPKSIKNLFDRSISETCFVLRESPNNKNNGRITLQRKRKTCIWIPQKKIARHLTKQIKNFSFRFVKKSWKCILYYKQIKKQIMGRGDNYYLYIVDYLLFF